MNPTSFKYGIRLPQATEDNSKLKLVAIDDDGNIQAYITEIPASMLPPIAITSVIIATETTISDFASNSGSYTFEQGDVIVLDNGNGNYYMYNGGTKTDVSAYNEITASEIDWNQIVNVPTDVTNPTLEDVLNNGIFGGINNNIILQGDGYLRTDNNIKIKPKLAITESDGYSSIGVLSEDLFYLLQTKNTGENSYYLGLDISNLTANRVVEIQDFGGKLPVLGVNTNDGDFEINGIFTGNGSGLTDVNATQLGGQPASYYNFRNYGLGGSAISTNNFDTIDATGFYYNPAPGAVGQPANLGLLCISHFQIDNNTATQDARRAGGDQQWYRRKIGGVWYPWVELITEDNISNYSSLPAGFYEEGTFTPTLVDAGGGATYSFTVDEANYVRQGNSVTFNIRLLSINTTGTPSGILQLGNLPFNTSTNVNPISVSAFTGSDLSSSNLDRLAARVTTSNYILFKSVSSAAVSVAITFSSGVIEVGGTYITNVYTP